MNLRLNNTPLGGHDLTVVAALDLAGDSLSGQGSGTEVAETGDKPKKLTVEVKFRFDDIDELQLLVDLAQARDSAGSREVYTVTNLTAEAMGVREARFLGELTAREDSELERWLVRFQLQEVRSVPELAQARQTAPPVTDTTPAGTDTSTDQATPTVADLSGFEKLLSWVDEQIGPAA